MCFRKRVCIHSLENLVEALGESLFLVSDRHQNVDAYGNSVPCYQRVGRYPQLPLDAHVRFDSPAEINHHPARLGPMKSRPRNWMQTRVDGCRFRNMRRRMQFDLQRIAWMSTWIPTDKQFSQCGSETALPTIVGITQCAAVDRTADARRIKHVALLSPMHQQIADVSSRLNRTGTNHAHQ